ncbi:MAG TPA: TetR family transcriptional regulator [Trebonia sp.]|jgi:AcrR family transcriptional regulator|nr:TetR family transcriptional regulator [Trebonia sp.]
MNGRAPDWTAGPASGQAAERLRERKKRLMRQQLSDTATAMFIERGFDEVRVTEVAAACGVSEKTVFNYFPVKEALVMDRLETTLAALRAGLANPARTPVQAMLTILDGELGAMTGQLADPEDPSRGSQAIRRFGDLIRATPSLRAYQADMMDQSVTAATEILAARAGMTADDPEPQIAARALLGLWRVMGDSLRKHLDNAPTPACLHKLVTADVGRAAQLIDTGLRTFASPMPQPASSPAAALRPPPTARPGG